MVAMATKLPQQQCVWLATIVLNNLHTKYELHTVKDKRLLRYPCGCHGNLATIATTYLAGSFCLKT